MDERLIQNFWNSYPCGDVLIGGLRERFDGEYREFFRTYDEWRYNQEAHIPGCLDRLGVRDLQVLEVGLGQGADSEQLIRRGAHWTGVDLTAEAVDRVRVRLRLGDLPFEGLHQASVHKLPFPDDSFDMVFSHGVLHHVPDVRSAQAEIHRVLRHDGRLVVMLYAKNSLNYQVSIRVIRRVAILLMYPLWRMSLLSPSGIVGDHLTNARAEGLLRYLAIDSFTDRSTDGPHNPHSRVYSVADVQCDFPSFEVVKVYKRYLHAPPLPIGRLRGLRVLERLLGWHLWVEMSPTVDASSPRATKASAVAMPWA